MVNFAFLYVVLYKETATWVAVLIGIMVTLLSIKAIRLMMLQVLAVAILHARKISSKL